MLALVVMADCSRLGVSRLGVKCLMKGMVKCVLAESVCKCIRQNVCKIQMTIMHIYFMTACFLRLMGDHQDQVKSLKPISDVKPGQHAFCCTFLVATFHKLKTSLSMTLVIFSNLLIQYHYKFTDVQGLHLMWEHAQPQHAGTWCDYITPQQVGTLHHGKWGPGVILLPTLAALKVRGNSQYTVYVSTLHICLQHLSATLG